MISRKVSNLFNLKYFNNNFQKKVINPRDIKIFVLDEADEMLSRGFKDQIYDIFRTLPGNIQVNFINYLKN